MMTDPYRICLFDFDGTLVDSMPTFSGTMRRLLEENSLPYDPGVTKEIAPLGYPGSADYLIRRGVNESREELISRMRRYMLDEYAFRIPAKPHVTEVLRQLKARGIALYVLSGSPHGALDPCLARVGLTELFTEIWSVDDFGTVKNDPAIYGMAAEKIGAPVSEILFFDDNYYSARTAKTAGMPVCGVYDATSAEYEEEIRGITDLYIHDFAELLKEKTDASGAAKTTVYLIRHAEAEGNLYRLMHGHYDAGLTERGYRQLPYLKKRFLDVPLDAVYASDLFRARMTASALSVPKGLEIRTMPELREIGMGIWEGKPFGEFMYENPEMYRNYNYDPDKWQVEGAETYAQVRDRMLKALRQIIRDNPGRTVAVVSHAKALRTLIGTLQGMSLWEIGQSPHSDNTGVTKVEAEGEDIRVIYRDDAGHLPEELSTFAAQRKHTGGNAAELNAVRYRTDRADDRLEVTVLIKEEEAGFLSAHLEPDCLRVDRYELIPSVRGRHFGAQPLGQAVSFAREKARGFIRLKPPAESTGFFARCGFTPMEDGDWSMDIRLIIREIP